jgi:hypothetical protein
MVGNTLLDLILNNVILFVRSDPIYYAKDGKRHNFISIHPDYKDKQA